jgi:hypothetical protein
LKVPSRAFLRHGYGTGAIFINGKKVVTGRIEHTISYLFDTETADVGEELYIHRTTPKATTSSPGKSTT